MKGDRRLGGDVSRVRRALTAVFVSAGVAVAVSTPMALRVADAQHGDDPADTTVAPSTVPASVLGTNEVREEPDTQGGG